MYCDCVAEQKAARCHPERGSYHVSLAQGKIPTQNSNQSFCGMHTSFTPSESKNTKSTLPHWGLSVPEYSCHTCTFRSQHLKHPVSSPSTARSGQKPWHHCGQRAARSDGDSAGDGLSSLVGDQAEIPCQSSGSRFCFYSPKARSPQKFWALIP